jgi:HK97 gp10 family phage protein|tara:strand:+ start:72 stop:482 length:411 start_codon:yes stop_codon:yes gene_type:complete
MAVQPGVKVKNLREINKALAAIGVPKEAVKDAGKESGELVANEARSLAPVRTGALRDSIRVGATARGKITVLAGNNRTSKSAVPYANPIHWGWFKRHIRPQPFFVTALGYTRSEIYDNYFKQMEKLIIEETAKTKL